MKGIIFDFNGTMFLDSDLHEQAWLYMIEKYSDRKMQPSEIVTNIHGKTNDAILKYFISDQLTPQQIADLAHEKEGYYRQLVQLDPTRIKLTKGLETTLNQLKADHIPLTIASASPKSNMDFYFQVFDLDRWFDYSKVIVDNGTFPGKPAPDIFLRAAEKLELSPSDCMVLEDSYSGLKAANNADIGYIVGIDPDGMNRSLFEKEQLAKTGIITDFTHFATNIIEPLLVS